MIDDADTFCLLLENLTRQDSGNYTSLAGNRIGNGSFETSLIVLCPPVFASDNKKLQYGELGKPMEISIKGYSTSAITCHYLNAIGRLSSLESIWNISSKIVLMSIHFHGVSISVNVIEVTFRLAILHHFQTFNVTVCNNVSSNNFNVEVKQIVGYSLEEKVLSSQDIAIMVLVMIIVIRVAGMGSSQCMWTPQTSIQYESKEQLLKIGIQPWRLQNNHLHHRTNDNSISEHLENGYEYPYTTLVVNNRTEDEHVYLRTRNSTAFENAVCGRSFELTEEDLLPDETKTHCYANKGQANVNLNDDGNDSKETDNNSDQTFIHLKNKAEYIIVLLKQ
ncbi:unnamed protein product [Mytilus coruscus]|uniref:Uncharacterized protein n=1 Tax=Mytilus coruscus TaxID=42192 RepID=A0A6J8A7U8_MYTCO|nr:unnamed protein product [Mytilus coruscus]